MTSNMSSTLAKLLEVFNISFVDALAIVSSDGWFSNKTNESHPRFINLTNGEKSNTPALGFTQVDVDAMNWVEDRKNLTPEILAQNPRLLAAFAFSVKCNQHVLQKFSEIITYLREKHVNVESLSAFRKVFVAHLAWALANIGDKPSWSKISDDPLIKAILAVNNKLPLPKFEDASDAGSAYFAAFETVILTTTDTQIADGIRMDADRFENYFATLN